MRRRLDEAADRPAFLALPTAEKPEESVALAFALSYDALDEDDQELFRPAPRSLSSQQRSR